MPIFDYACPHCGHRFEALVRRSTVPSCPSCKSHDLEQQLSVFAVGGQSARSPARQPAGPCGTCGDPRGPGACSID